MESEHILFDICENCYGNKAILCALCQNSESDEYVSYEPGQELI
jgi:hypothetical protein